MDRILIVEEDELINSGICYNLSMENMESVPAYDVKSAKKRLDETWNMIILDVNLPDGSGIELCEFIRSRSKIPIIFLTANDLDSDVINGFRAGADDYIVRPFSIGVLLERIKAVLRRYTPPDRKPYQFGNLYVDLSGSLVKKDGGVLDLTPIEYQLVKNLVLNHGQIVTRKKLLESIWDNKGNFVDEHTLTSNISRLRQKISDNNFEYIKSSMAWVINGRKW